MDRLTTCKEITSETDMTKEWGYSHIYKRLAEYEDAEAHGKLIILPVAVGEIVYYIGTQNYTEKAVFGTQVDDLLYPVVYRTYDFTFHKDDIGKTIFLTREEAEIFLKGKK